MSRRFISQAQREDIRAMLLEGKTPRQVHAANPGVSIVTIYTIRREILNPAPAIDVEKLRAEISEEKTQLEKLQARLNQKLKILAILQESEAVNKNKKEIASHAS